MDETKIIKLRKPITYGKGDTAKTLDSITLREPLAGEFETAEKASDVYGMPVALIAVLTSIPIDAVDMMFSSQIDEAEEYIGAFVAENGPSATRSDDEYVLQLLQPVKLVEEPNALNISSLALSEPTNNQRRKARMAGGSFAASVALISINAGVPRKSVRAMCARDFLSAVNYFNGFQAGRPADSDD